MKSVFSPQELVTKVKKLSSKYWGNRHKEDIEQEAYLAYYEALDRGVTGEGKLVTIMRKAMYHTVKTQDQPTKIPKGGDVYKLTKTLSKEEINNLKQTERLIYEALQGYSIDFDEVSDILTSGGIPIEDSISVRQGFHDTLDLREQFVILNVILEERTLASVAYDLDISPQRVDKIKEKALEKLKDFISG